MTPISTRKTPKPQRVAYLVLGMHRSGTSAMTQVLALAGASLPDNVMPGDDFNAKGYFEPWRIAVFNDERLRAAGGAWDDPFAHPYVEVSDPADWHDRARRLFRQEFRRTKYPLLKDPRVSVLLPLWRSVLASESVEARCVIPVRHPLAVAGSLAKRDQFPIVKSVLLWITYMVAAEAGSRDLARVFVDYEALLADWRPELTRMEAALGAPMPRMNATIAKQIDGFLSPELRHNGSGGDLNGLGEVGMVAAEVYTWFKTRASGDVPGREPLERALQLLIKMRSEMGEFVSPVTRALNLARSELATSHAALALEAERRIAAEAQISALSSERAEFEATLDRLIAVPQS